jgi:hypothetical protein
MSSSGKPPGSCEVRTEATEKLEGPEYKREEGIPWTILVDDYAGTVHRAYSGEMADPVFLIDSDGRVSLLRMWRTARR